MTKPKCRIGIANVTYCQIKDVLLEIGYILLREIIILYLIKNRGCHFVILTQICRLLLLATARGNEVEFFWVLLIVKSHWNTVIYVIYNDHWNQRHICFFIINKCLPLKMCSSYELHYQKSKFRNMYLKYNF